MLQTALSRVVRPLPPEAHLVICWDLASSLSTQILPDPNCISLVAPLEVRDNNPRTRESDF